MTKPLIQIGDEIREMTDAEHKQHVADQKAANADAENVATQAALRATALKKLGLTADEIAALFGQ